MRVSILIVSYSKDKPWLIHCINSINKFARGFHDVKLLWPDDESSDLHGVPSIKVVFYNRNRNSALWHLDHQRMKCRADEIHYDADVIFHIDSDTYFNAPITPDDVCPGGKPMLVIGTYRAIKEKEGIDMPWKKVTDDVMGGDNQYETIRLPHPCYRRLMYADMRQYIALRHKQDFDSFVISRKPDFPWGFCDNNMLGWMCLTPRWREQYHIVDVDKAGYPKINVGHFWSHSPIDKPQDAAGMGKNVPRQFIRRDGTVIPQHLYDYYGI